MKKRFYHLLDIENGFNDVLKKTNKIFTCSRAAHEYRDLYRKCLRAAGFDPLRLQIVIRFELSNNDN
jgi:hypothetical protein